MMAERYFCIVAVWPGERGEQSAPIENARAASADDALSGPDHAWRSAVREAYGADVARACSFRATEITRDEFEPT